MPSLLAFIGRLCAPPWQALAHLLLSPLCALPYQEVTAQVVASLGAATQVATSQVAATQGATSQAVMWQVFPRLVSHGLAFPVLEPP